MSTHLDVQRRRRLPRRDQLVVAVLTGLLGLGLLAVGAVVAWLLAWLLGPAWTVLIAVLAVVGFFVVRGAIRSANRTS